MRTAKIGQFCEIRKFFHTFAVHQPGELSEWLKEPASKTGVRQRTGGSNPSLTASTPANCWRFAVREGFHPLIPRRFAAAPRGMPAPLRSAGCLPVVALLLPPGTALMRPRFARKIGCNRRNPLPRVFIVPKVGTISTKKAVFVLIVPFCGTL